MDIQYVTNILYTYINHCVIIFVFGTVIRKKQLTSCRRYQPWLKVPEACFPGYGR